MFKTTGNSFVFKYPKPLCPKGLSLFLSLGQKISIVSVLSPHILVNTTFFCQIFVKLQMNCFPLIYGVLFVCLIVAKLVLKWFQVPIFK